MKRFLFLILIAALLFFFWLFSQKKDFNTPLILTSDIKEFSSPRAINFLPQKIDLTLSPDYSLKEKTENKQFNPLNIPSDDIKIPNFIQIGKCQSFVDTPDKLSNKLTSPSNKNEDEAKFHQIDCGIIQTSFPLSF